MKINELLTEQEQLDEINWKKGLATAALAGATALGGAGGMPQAHAYDNGTTQSSEVKQQNINVAYITGQRSQDEMSGDFEPSSNLTNRFVIKLSGNNLQLAPIDIKGNIGSYINLTYLGSDSKLGKKFNTYYNNEIAVRYYLDTTMTDSGPTRTVLLTPVDWVKYGYGYKYMMTIVYEGALSKVNLLDKSNDQSEKKPIAKIDLKDYTKDKNPVDYKLNY